MNSLVNQTERQNPINVLFKMPTLFTNFKYPIIVLRETEKTSIMDSYFKKDYDKSQLDILFPVK